MAVLCSNGHSNADEALFCSMCAAPLKEGAGGQADLTGLKASGADVSQRGGEAVRAEPVLPPPPTAVGPLEGSPPKSKTLLVLGAVGVVLVLAAGAFVATRVFGSDPKHELTGRLVLFDTEDVVGDADSCSGTGGYDDIGEGMNVKVRDGDGKIIASTSTHNLSMSQQISDEVAAEPGTSRAEAKETIETLSVVRCVVGFEVDVPETDFYEISVGSRGELSESRVDMEKKDWRVEYSLGS